LTLADGTVDCQGHVVPTQASAQPEPGHRRGFNQGGRKMKIRPLQDRVIVKRVEEETKTKGGIIIPDSAKEKPAEGKVIAVGKGKVREDGTLQPLDLKVGDRVLFSKYAGSEVKVDGDENLIMREDDILGVIEK
jgi:chaperonin GroES